MSIEKEIQLFEEWCDIFGLPVDEVDGEYADPRTAIAFLAWYEAVNREGYKLVPVVDTDAMWSAGRAVIEDNGYSADASDVYKAMIGACDD